MHSGRARFIWTWFVGGTDTDILYELSSTLAMMGRVTDAARALARAVDAGWADFNWLRHDPAFEILRDGSEVQRICADAAARVSLAPPVGSGGLG